MVRYRTGVIEKLRIDWPLFVLVPHVGTDHLSAEGADGVLEQEAVAFMHHIAQAFVVGCAVVGGHGCGGEPAFVDPAAVCTKGVKVLLGELQASAWHQERAWDPGRCESDDAFTGIQGGTGLILDIVAAHVFFQLSFRTFSGWNARRHKSPVGLSPHPLFF